MEDINLQLHEAALRGKIRTVKKLLKDDININHADQDGNTSLHNAVKKDHITVTELLINHGADIEKATTDGQTPLHLAASLGCLKATKCLLSQGANMDTEDNDGYSALYSAVMNCHLDVTKYLISQGAEVNKGNNKGRTALHVAAFNGHLKIMKYLISQGADVNNGNNDGKTALHNGAFNGHLDVTKYLISQGAEVNKEDNNGMGACHIAAVRGHLDVNKYLISQGADCSEGNGMTDLHIAAFSGHLRDAISLIREGAEVNKGDNDGRTAFHFAARQGHLEVIKYLTRKGADVNKRDNNGWNAFLGAAHGGHLDITKYLISQGAEMNNGDKHDRTALQLAAQVGHLDVTKYLISLGAEVNKGDNNGRTALHGAAHRGQLEVTKYLVSQGAKVNNGNNNDMTALHLAVQGGYHDVTKYLISLGAEMNKGDINGMTALHGAAAEGHLDVTKYLISLGANVNKGDNDGRTALHGAAHRGQLEVTKYLVGQGAEAKKGDSDGKTALHLAAAEGHLDVTKYLISQGAEVNKGDRDGKTALHFAAPKGHLDITEYVISHGAEVNKGDNDGETALHGNAENGHLDVTKYLISQGAKVNKKDRGGKTALHFAALWGHLEVTKCVIGRGDEVNMGNNEGRTALHFAAAEGHLDVTKYLISHRADVNKGADDGETALHGAAEKGHFDVTDYLISEGAKVNKGNNDGRTAFHLAAENGHLALTKYLISEGAEVNKRNNDGRTAFHLAAENGHLAHTKYLISQGAEVNMGNNEGRTALHFAADEGHLDVTKYLISHGAEVNKRNNEGRTAFQLAAENGHLTLTKFLIMKGAEVSEGDNHNSTAYYPAKDEHVAATERPTSHSGDECSKEDDQLRAALQSAAKDGHLDVTKKLISQGADVNKGNNEGWTALHSAAHNGHLDVTKYLISQGAELNKGDDSGMSALHSAAHRCHLEVTNYLISHGAEVNQGDNNGVTALHFAADEGHLDVTKCLISQGAEVNKENNDGMTPLHQAVQNGKIDVVKVLLAGGSNTGAINGQTPLQLSLLLGYQSIADLFIDRSNSKFAQNDVAEIHLAMQHGHTSIIEKLVSEGTDLNIQSTDGQTCLHKAIKLCYKSETIVQDTDTLKDISEEYYKGELSPEKALVFYLLENGAKLDVKDNTGNLPIQYAKDEVIKQMILSRLPSLEKIQSYRDKPSAPAIVYVEVERNTSKEIELEDHGVSMFIPPEAVHQNDPSKITLTLLRDPPSVDIQDGESVACYGIRCDPANMIFHQPVKIRIPHSTLAINPDQVKPDIVFHVWDSVNALPRTSRMRSSSSPDEPPYCRLYERHLELYIGKCAEWWVLIPLEQQVIRHQLMCTPYIPETVERGKEVEVHLHVHADVPGMDAEVRHDEKHQSYRKAHRSVPFSTISHAGDVTVTRDCDGKIRETKPLSLKKIHNRMRHNVVFNVPPSEDDVPINVITITLTQSGNLGMSRSMAFVIRYEDQIKSPEFTPVIREIEGTSRNDLPDKDVQKIAEKLSIDDFYDLGVALGFQIQQLDAIEYKRLKDRHEAICEMLITWKQRQLPHQNVKEELLSLLKSIETEAENTKMTAITLTSDISDQELLRLARHIKWTDFIEIGTKLGFSRNKLENIKHKTLQNRKDANIQMLCTWKASQRSDPEATETLKCIWQSVSLASRSTDENTDESLPPTSSATPEIRAPPSEPIEPEDMDIITTSETEWDEINDDLDHSGGTPSTEELCSVALPVTSLPLACSLGKALRLNDDLIVGFIDLPSSPVLQKIARQLVDSWWNGLKDDEKGIKFARLLSEFKISDVKTVSIGCEEISKSIGSKIKLLDLCHRLSVKSSGVLLVMSTFVIFPPHMIGRSALKMLNEWVHHGGTRKRLLEVAQAFRFNEAAVKIAEAMTFQASYKPFFSHGIIGHKGGELTLDELGIAVSIPEGAIPKGMRSVVTLSVPTHDTPRLPVREGEVVITPVIEGSLTQELLKPATVVLPHCTTQNERKDDSSVILYTRTGPGTFGRRNMNPSQISKDTITFRTRHLQVWALSSTDLQGLQLKCVVFQPLFMTHAEKPTLRVYILHPYRNYGEDIARKETSSSVPYCRVLKEFTFSIESETRDLQILFDDGTKRNEKTMPIKSTLSGQCSPLNFELEFSPEEKGKKNGHIDILQGSATRAEREFIISIEDEPEYAVDHTDSQGRLQYVSNNLLETLAGVIQTTKDLKSLGNQLGFSPSSMKKYNDPADVSFDSVSRSGFGEMLRDWRRHVRPSEQVDDLHLALQKAGLGHAAQVILHDLSSRRRFYEARQVWESKT